MLDADRLKRVLKLHDKSFGLFRWLNEQLRRGVRPLSAVEETLTFADAASGWLRRNLSNLPPDYRPEADEVDEMAHLFVSYLGTSFQLVDQAAVRACPGCWCCIYWIRNKHLHVRNPDKKAMSEGRALKMLYLKNLAEEAGYPLTDAEVEKFYAARRDLWPAVSVATYLRELDRRSKFASQGEGVLALFREAIHEASGRADGRDQFKPKDGVEAEASLRTALSEFAGKL